MGKWDRWVYVKGLQNPSPYWISSISSGFYLVPKNYFGVKRGKKKDEVDDFGVQDYGQRRLAISEYESLLIRIELARFEIESIPRRLIWIYNLRFLEFLTICDIVLDFEQLVGAAFPFSPISGFRLIRGFGFELFSECFEVGFGRVTSRVLVVLRRA